MYNPLKISNFFIQEYGRDNKITPMKLVKLVYISHGWYLGITDNALIDQNPEAWQYGPVIPSVYHFYKTCGSSSIDPDKYNYSDSELPEKIKSLLRKIWQVYNEYSALQLSDMTHRVGSPWYQTVHNRLNYTQQIHDNLIRDYYKKRIHNNKEVPKGA